MTLKMRVFVTPSVDGYFSHQLAMMKMFETPDLMLGAGEGNIANYVYGCQVSNDVDVVELFSGDPNSLDLEETVRLSGRIEKVTLVSKKDNSSVLFTNRSQGESYLGKMRLFRENQELYGFSLKFGNENIPKITHAMKNSHGYPSPFTILQYSLRIYSPTQILYFCPFNLSKETVEDTYALRAESALGLSFLLGKGKMYHAHISVEELNNLRNRRYYAVVYPKVHETPLDLLTMCAEDISSIEKKIRPTIECSVWYLE
jgi:hypothetical protein